MNYFHLYSFWQIMDVRLLETRLLENVFYLHAQPPLFNFFLGIFLKIFGPHALSTFQLTYMLLGLGTGWLMFALLRMLGLPRTWCYAVSLYYLFSPACILYENFLLYTYPAAFLLTFAAFMMAKLAQTPTWHRYVVFLSALLAEVWLRALFHPFWFAVYEGYNFVRKCIGQRVPRGKVFCSILGDCTFWRQRFSSRSVINPFIYFPKIEH